MIVHFIWECLGVDRPLYRWADPLGRNPYGVQTPGQEFPWHFDGNEFTISMLVQKADQGGVFEYVPNIRRPDAENFEHVAHILAGGRDGVRELDLIPGDLQLFAGRYSLHRVTPVVGATTRYNGAPLVRVRPVSDEPVVPLRDDLRPGDRVPPRSRTCAGRRAGRLTVAGLRLAFIGLGNMGAPMARNLLDAGFDVTVTDLDPTKVDALVALGATAAPHAVAAVAGLPMSCSPHCPGPHRCERSASRSCRRCGAARPGSS